MFEEEAIIARSTRKITHHDGIFQKSSPIYPGSLKPALECEPSGAGPCDVGSKRCDTSRAGHNETKNHIKRADWHQAGLLRNKSAKKCYADYFHGSKDFTLPLSSHLPPDASLLALYFPRWRCHIKRIRPNSIHEACDPIQTLLVSISCQCWDATAPSHLSLQRVSLRVQPPARHRHPRDISTCH